MKIKIVEYAKNDCIVAHDSTLVENLECDHFNIQHWIAQGQSPASAQGRGSTYFISVNHNHIALRHYQRGGLIRHFLFDQYLWLGLRDTRAWKEIHVLDFIIEKGLPAPQPVAIRILRQGAFYTADIMTLVIEQSSTLADQLRQSRLSQDQWRNIGWTIKRFHDAGVDHADLNANNILIDRENAVYLIDFDRARIRNRPGSWATSNLKRLHRSLNKLSLYESRFYYDENDWTACLTGYKQARKTS